MEALKFNSHSFLDHPNIPIAHAGSREQLHRQLIKAANTYKGLSLILSNIYNDNLSGNLDRTLGVKHGQLLISNICISANYPRNRTSSPTQP
ncbi:hypothetical protein [Sphingobacterium hotanense]|uniref:hypothetical protein n=1 Tax=Sphingobacterium hotanense TaxID=649196 RepID=UPI0011F1CDF0|nr:hypothetical protein [Sphingobacterium hotanense]